MEEIRRIPAFAKINNQNIEINKDVLINEADEVISVVSKKYNLVQNRDVIEYFDTAFDKYNTRTIKDNFNLNKSKWCREIVFEDDEFIKQITSDDIVNLKINIFNGYDGKTSTGFSLSAYRQVCSNGMFGWDKLFSTKLNHWGNGNIIKEIKINFKHHFSNYLKIFDKMSKWNEIGYTNESFLEFVDSRTKVEDKNEKSRFLSENQSLKIKDLSASILNKYNDEETLWGFYNVLTYMGTHSNSNMFSAETKRYNRLTEDFIDMIEPVSYTNLVSI